ncbi:hypothetical protein PCANB_003074 [Pneumocystis canis]|nr:hypothetical protein PCK1_003057 [Pneumocystis canis]KAG5438223.1 hypothetical protein PCANB_003074 [Pneumocystis canis]
MESSDSKMSSKWSLSPNIITSSLQDAPQGASSMELGNASQENLSYDNIQLLKKPFKNAYHPGNTLNNPLNETLNTSIHLVSSLQSSLKTPFLQTSMETHNPITLTVSENIVSNTINAHQQVETAAFLSEKSKHVFEEIAQEKQKKTLNDAMHIKKNNIDTSTTRTGNTYSHKLGFPEYQETNGNKDLMFQENKKDIQFKFPGIPIPNLPFATIMDVQTDNLLLEKVPLQNKPNITKKNEVPVLKSETSVIKSESIPKNETVVSRNDVLVPKEIALSKSEPLLPQNGVSLSKNGLLMSKNEILMSKNQSRSKNQDDGLLYELRKCFSVHAVTGDTRNCIRTVYDLMKDIVEDKAKIVILEALKGGIKDDIITAFIENKQVLGRIRNWLVNAINEKKNAIIIAILKIMSVLKLDASTLAELKMGKPIMILIKKSENETVKQLSAKWLEVAEKSLLLEKSTENSATSNVPSISVIEDASKKKQKSISNDSVPKSSATSKPNPAKPMIKSQKIQPVVNTDFFKNLSAPSKLPSQKPSLSSVLAQIKTPKKSSATQPQVIETVGTSKKFTSVLEEVPGFQTIQETNTTDITQTSNDVPKKKRKCVSWKSDNDLVEIRIFESHESEETDDSFVHIFREFKNARDLDIYEGRAAFSKTHNIEDDMMTWREPEDIDFSHLESELPKLGPKRGGINKCNSDEYKVQEEREKFVFLVSYLYEKDIPYSPTEPNIDSDGPFVETKMIPLPNNAKDSSLPDYIFQHNQGSINHLAFSNTLNQNNAPLTNPSLINNTQANITSILQNLLNASGQAPLNTLLSMPPISQTMQHVSLSSSAFQPVNIANISNILQMLQKTQKKSVQPSFPIPTVSSTVSPFNFDALLGGQQKTHSYTDWGERSDISHSRDKRHRSQRHRRR